MPMAELIDLDKERARLEKELEKARKNYEGQMRKLSNENFISRAPEAVVQTERERAEKAKALVESRGQPEKPRLSPRVRQKTTAALRYNNTVYGFGRMRCFSFRIGGTSRCGS